MFNYKKLVLSALILNLLSLPVGLSQSESLIGQAIFAQTSVTSAHMWELGMHTGVPLALGDLKHQPGYGGGVHVRRALDYVFSLRSELFVGSLHNRNEYDGRTRTTWNGGTFEVIASLNNLVWNTRKNRKTNVYGLIGGGLNFFKVEIVEAISADIRPKAYNLQSHGGLGLGCSVRLNERFNIGLETKAWVLFGRDNDRLDAVERQEGDVLCYPSIRLNCNLGNTEKKSEPLYWVNPLDAVLRGITELKNLSLSDLTDTDQDGVIDRFDQDNNTPPGVPVDTRGLSLDSDGDGIPDYKDPEPFFPFDRQGHEIAEPATSEADVRRKRQEQQKKYDQKGTLPQSDFDNNAGVDPGSYLLTEEIDKIGLVNWFLPLVHFDIDSYQIRRVDYGTLESIGKLMKENEQLRLVVTGFADQTTSNKYNNALSYQRAKSVIDHLVEMHSIERRRLLLHYNGATDPLVPSNRSNLMNRRVEFRTATSEDNDMSIPDAILKRKGEN